MKITEKFVERSDEDMIMQLEIVLSNLWKRKSKFGKLIALKAVFRPKAFIRENWVPVMKKYFEIGQKHPSYTLRTNIGFPFELKNSENGKEF